MLNLKSKSFVLDVWVRYWNIAIPDLYIQILPIDKKKMATLCHLTRIQWKANLDWLNLFIFIYNKVVLKILHYPVSIFHLIFWVKIWNLSDQGKVNMVLVILLMSGRRRKKLRHGRGNTTGEVYLQLGEMRGIVSGRGFLDFLVIYNWHRTHNSVSGTGFTC